MTAMPVVGQSVGQDDLSSPRLRSMESASGAPLALRTLAVERTSHTRLSVPRGVSERPRGESDSSHRSWRECAHGVNDAASSTKRARREEAIEKTHDRIVGEVVFVN